MYQETEKSNIQFIPTHRSLLTDKAAQLIEFFMKKNGIYTREECAEALNYKKKKGFKLYKMFSKNDVAFKDFNSMRTALMAETEEQLAALLKSIRSLPAQYTYPFLIQNKTRNTLPVNVDNYVSFKEDLSEKEASLYKVNLQVNLKADQGHKPDIEEKLTCNSFNDEDDLFSQIAPLGLINDYSNLNDALELESALMAEGNRKPDLDNDMQTIEHTEKNTKKRTQEKNIYRESPALKRKKIQAEAVLQCENSFSPTADPGSHLSTNIENYSFGFPGKETLISTRCPSKFSSLPTFFCPANNLQRTTKAENRLVNNGADIADDASYDRWKPL